MHAITIIIFFLACIFADPGDPAVRGFYTCFIHANFTSHTTSSSLPCPPTQDSLSLHHLPILGGHLHSICQLSNLFLGLLLLKSIMRKLDGGIISTVFQDHHTPIEIVATPIEALDTALVYLQWPLANPVLKPEVCRSSVHYNFPR